MNNLTPSTTKILLADDSDDPNLKTPPSIGWCPMGLFLACCFFAYKWPAGYVTADCDFSPYDGKCDQPSDIRWFCCKAIMKKTENSGDYKESLPNVGTCKPINRGPAPTAPAKPSDLPQRKPEKEPNENFAPICPSNWTLHSQVLDNPKWKGWMGSCDTTIGEVEIVGSNTVCRKRGGSMPEGSYLINDFSNSFLRIGAVHTRFAATLQHCNFKKLNGPKIHCGG